MQKKIAEDYHKRFKQVIDLLDTNYIEMAERAKMSKDTFYTMKSAGRTPSFETLYKIKQHYPQINVDFLISGQGKPLLGPQDYQKTVNSPSNPKDEKTNGELIDVPGFTELALMLKDVFTETINSHKALQSYLETKPV